MYRLMSFFTSIFLTVFALTSSIQSETALVFNENFDSYSDGMLPSGWVKFGGPGRREILRGQFVDVDDAFSSFSQYYYADKKFGDGIYEFERTISNRSFNQGFSWKHDLSSLGGNRYDLLFRTSSLIPPSNHTRLRKFVNAQEVILGDIDREFLSVHKIRVEDFEGRIKVFADNELIFNVADPTPISTSGHIWVSSGDRGGGDAIDNISIYTTNEQPSTFTIGSTSEDVKIVQGEPSRVTDLFSQGSFWYHYGNSRVEFENNRVSAYDNRGNLNVHIGDAVASAIFTLGSTSVEVIQAQGTPSQVTDLFSVGSYWYHYGSSRVEFENDQVSAYNNRGNLNVYIGDAVAGATFALGSSPVDVIRAQGTPSQVTDLFSSGSYWYHYGSSRIEFENDRVSAYDNRGNLNLQIGGNNTSDPPQSVGPRIAISPNVLTFENVEVEQAKTLLLTLTNVGDTPLSISDIKSGNDRFIPQPPLSFSIESGQSLQVSVIFRPTAVGDQTATLSVISNDTNQQTATVFLSGTGVPTLTPTISVTPIGIDFGTVIAGQSGVKTLTVTNTGQQLLTISEIASSSNVFTVSSPSFSLTPNSTRDITITFQPTGVGDQTAILRITSNDPANTVVSVTVSGVGQVESGPITETPKLSVFPAIINFGEAAIGQSKSLSLSISNAGVGMLRVLNIVTSSSDFSVSETGLSLSAGQEKTLTITFLPSKSGTINETLDIPSNDPEKPLVQVPLRATVRSGSGGTPSIVLGVNKLEFGEVGATGVAELNLPIRNEGSATLNIFNVVSRDLQVAVVPRSLSVPPQATRTLSVRFHPRPGRSRMGEIVINSDDPAQPAVLITWEAIIDVAGQVLTVVSSIPATGSVDVDLGTELTIRLSDPLLRSQQFVALNVSLIPRAASGALLDNFTLADDDQEIRFSVKLSPDTFYRLVLSDATGRSGAKLAEGYEVGFSTGSVPLVLGSVSGLVSFQDARAFEGSVVVFDDQGNLLKDEAIGEAGAYTLTDLPSGNYRVFADVFAEGVGAVSGGYDQDGDGRPDILTLASGQDATAIDIVCWWHQRSSQKIPQARLLCQ